MNFDPHHVPRWVWHVATPSATHDTYWLGPGPRGERQQGCRGCVPPPTQEVQLPVASRYLIDVQDLGWCVVGVV